MNRSEQYKRRSAGFGNANAGRLARAGRHEDQRRLNRAENVARHRALGGDAERETSSSRQIDTGARLRKWKEEQRLRKKLEEQTKKPIFKVGIVHHKIYSPPFSDRFTKKNQPVNPKGAKRRVLTRSFAPPNYTFTAPSGVIEIPMFGRIAVASPKCPEWTQIMKGRLEWQTAVVRLSGASSPVATNRNCSSDFRSRSSSKNGSTAEANVEDKSSSEVADFVNCQPRTATSRSGTPVFSFSPYMTESRAKNSVRKEPTNRTSIRRSSVNEIPTTAKVNKSKEFSGNESCPSKFPRKVDFNDDVVLEKVPAAETAQKFINNNTDNGHVLARSLSFDCDDNFVEPHDTMKNVTVRNIKKRLDFEHESFDEYENTNTDESATTMAAVPESTVIPDIVLTLPTPMKKTS